jgi:hypothetical protein
MAKTYKTFLVFRLESSSPIRKIFVMRPKTLHESLALLSPFGVSNCRKVRIGAPNDGGYVMIDRFRPDQVVFSYGLSWNIAFEYELAERGHQVFMFDHTIDALSVQHPNFYWHKEGIAGTTSPDGTLFSLENHVDRLAPGKTDMILKIDVEGAEWEVLANVPDDVLCRFEQIVLELHDLHRLGDETWRERTTTGLAKLARHFTLFNAHANNHAPLVVIDNTHPVPDVIEVSYARSDTVERSPSTSLFPSYLDAPNAPLRPEIPLWFFPFMPSGLSAATEPEAIELASKRFDQDLALACCQQQLEATEARLVTAVAAPGRGELPNLPPLTPGGALKILCISVHPVLEYDEIKLFESLGHQVFSLGFYFDRTNSGNLRPKMTETSWHIDCAEAFSSTGCRRVAEPAQWSVSRAFCERFDLIVVHQNYFFIADNASELTHSRVVWRTIGQGVHWSEDAMRDARRRGVKVVRWSPEERLIDRYIGADCVIRSVKDPEDWGGWKGDVERVVTFNNSFRARGLGMSFEFHQQCVQGLPFDLYGLDNGDVPQWRGTVDYQQQQEILRSYRAAFITGTNPAPYTLGFIEAWMTGIPVVHVGRRRFAGDAAGVYEIDRLIIHGENGFLVDEVEEAREVLRELLVSHALCSRISAAGRASAIEYFGHERARHEWSDFIRDHVTC